MCLFSGLKLATPEIQLLSGSDMHRLICCLSRMPFIAVHLNMQTPAVCLYVLYKVVCH